MSEQILKTHDKSFMGDDPMGKLLIKLSVPAMIGMMVNALYNFVDTIFVGQGVGPLGIAGLSIAFLSKCLLGLLLRLLESEVHQLFQEG